MGFNAGQSTPLGSGLGVNVRDNVRLILGILLGYGQVKGLMLSIMLGILLGYGQVKGLLLGILLGYGQV